MMIKWLDGRVILLALLANCWAACLAADSNQTTTTTMDITTTTTTSTTIAPQTFQTTSTLTVNEDENRKPMEEMEPEVRTTVKKELQPTEATTAASSAAQSAQVVEGVARAGELAGQLSGQLNEAMKEATKVEDDNNDGVPEKLQPSRGSLFNSDALDLKALGQMDCHLRNVDYCVAGMLGTSSKLLPETDDEFEVRCDEMKATTTCLATYNKRCSTFKVFAALAPFAQAGAGGPGGPAGAQLRAAKLPGEAERLLMNSNQNQTTSGGQLAVGDLMSACEPDDKRKGPNRALRARMFTLAKCLNGRLPKLRPCLEDLKAALQVFYEPSRTLPLRPTCCALSRFRDCSSRALDKVCGLSSFDKLLEQLTSGAGSSSSSPVGPISMVKSIEQICRQSSFDWRSAYCSELLPPSGMRAPQRRGPKASKLAKALDLISFAPAAQEMSFT